MNSIIMKIEMKIIIIEMNNKDVIIIIIMV